MKKQIYSIMVGAIVLASTAGAQNLIVNGSFEEGVLTASFYNLLPGDSADAENSTNWLVGWNFGGEGYTGSGLNVITHRQSTNASDGNQVVALQRDAGPLWQEVTLEAGVTYKLSFDVLRLIVNSNSAISYKLSVYSDTETVIDVIYPLQLAANVWDTSEYVFTAEESNTYIFSIAHYGVGTAALWLDNVSLTAVPEPATYTALFGAGAIALAFWQKKWRS
ncbi:PEP-CTERM motif protein [Opitutaceae bacterium TAV1]|nr:PEP-CTERM motif protein [Opitutaceae bacterium TAV5]EIP96655.1 PEP-CTERM motif protein [Opitutaceae bacterium TAV1]